MKELACIYPCCFAAWLFGLGMDFFFGPWISARISLMNFSMDFFMDFFSAQSLKKYTRKPPEKFMEKSMEKFMEESRGKFRLGIRCRNQAPKPCGAAAPQPRNVSHAHRGRQDEVILNSVLGTRPILLFWLSDAEASLDHNHQLSLKISFCGFGDRKTLCPQPDPAQPP